MSEPWPDALFGVDGTELPVLVPQQSGGGQEDTTVLPSLSLPPIPPLSMTRDEIAAALREDSAGLAGHDPVAAPASPPAAPAPQPPQASAAPSQPGPPTPRATGSTSAGAPTRRPTRPVISAAPLPAPGPSRGLGALNYARRVVPGTRLLVQRRDPRRRAGGVQTRSRSDGGAGAFFIIMFITFAVLLYFIVSGIVAAFARLIP
jgi:hypothetical protein